MADALATQVATITLESRRLGGGIVVTFGVLAILTGLWTNPVIGRVLKGPLVVDFADVLRGYFWWSMIIGAVLIALGRRVMRGKSRVDGLAVLAVMVGGIILFDRYLLARFGLPLWAYDAEIRYHHRPGAIRTLAGAGRPEDHVVINEWGFHDTSFPIDKPAGEFRALMLGDSVTMGYGLTYAETFNAHLETLLAARDRTFSSHQVINTGVHGYSTFQERKVLERTLVFEPDVVFVGFCLNDVTEPWVVDTEYGGVGLDYHGVSQTPNPIVGWLSNETGLGRLMQTMAQRGKSLEALKRLEEYNARTMALESRTSPKMIEAWKIVLQQMGELYGVAKANGVPVVLVIFPFHFQLGDPSVLAPQEILTAHAAEHGVPVIDTTSDFANAVFDDPALLEYMRKAGKTPEEILEYHRHKLQKYFFDEDHFTELGHRLVADRLFAHLVAAGMVTDAGG